MVETVAVARDGKFALVGGSRDGRIAILDLNDYSLRWHLRTGIGIFGLDIACDTDSVGVTSGNNIETFHITGRPGGEGIYTGGHDTVHSVAFAPDFSCLASIGSRPWITSGFVDPLGALGALRGEFLSSLRSCRIATV
jgi:hypothetical protein